MIRKRLVFSLTGGTFARIDIYIYLFFGCELSKVAQNSKKLLVLSPRSADNHLP